MEKFPQEAIFLRKFGYLGAALAGARAGIVNGIFGGAGGMVLIPALRMWTCSWCWMKPGK